MSVAICICTKYFSTSMRSFSIHGKTRFNDVLRVMSRTPVSMIYTYKHCPGTLLFVLVAISVVIAYTASCSSTEICLQHLITIPSLQLVLSVQQYVLHKNKQTNKTKQTNSRSAFYKALLCLSACVHTHTHQG